MSRGSCRRGWIDCKQKLAEATSTTLTSTAATGSSSYSLSDLEDIIPKVSLEEKAFTRACFAGIEDRLLPEKRSRPPLAADRAPAAMLDPATVPAPTTSGQPQAPKLSLRASKKFKAAAPLAPSTSADAQAEPETTETASLSQQVDAGEISTILPSESWTEVVKRGKNGKKVPIITPAAPAANRAPATPSKNSYRSVNTTEMSMY
ncbi:hypothetical protein SFRURICE_006213 [Spodoptera frugiperda]|uniref:SFRICE_038419 n=1 Tax=Spodoptera frugiperda TaxID=7108 RepID=A0A2H1WID8_SPOFR|nr:hypothetical protein SFRURICE_006213 [Spodoptera frugiperda]